MPWDSQGRWVTESDFAAGAVAPTVLVGPATSQSSVFDLTGAESINATLGLHAFLRTAHASANNDLDIIARTPGAAAAALATTAMAGTNNDITLTGVRNGEDLNGWRLRIFGAEGASQSLAVSADTATKEIKVTPATNTSSAITTTGGQLVTALNGNATVSARFTAANAGGNDGTGVITALDAAVTSGGIGATSIRVTFTVAGASTPLTIAVSGLDITVNVATNGGSAAISTASEVKAAIEASAAASALVVVNLQASNDGTGVVAAAGQAPLVVPQGTTPTLDVTLQHDHNDSVWDTVDNFAQKTTILTAEEDTFGPLGERGRWNYVEAGASSLYAISLSNVHTDPV